MTHTLFLSIHRQDEEVQTFASCQKFDEIGAEKFRDEILRQINNVLSGEKQNLIIPFGDMMGPNSDSVTMIPGDVVRGNPIVIEVMNEKDIDWDNPDEMGAYSNVDSTYLG